jgi:hypothetical protein
VKQHEAQAAVLKKAAASAARVKSAHAPSFPEIFRVPADFIRYI